MLLRAAKHVRAAYSVGMAVRLSSVEVVPSSGRPVRREVGPKPRNPVRREWLPMAKSVGEDLDDALVVGEYRPETRVIHLPDAEMSSKPQTSLRKLQERRRLGMDILQNPPREENLPSGSPSEEFMTKIRELKVFKSLYFDLHVPKTLWDNQELGKWVAEQKARYVLRWMTVEEKAELDRIDFVWSKSVESAQWHLMFHELRRFKAVYGHCDVPEDWKSLDWPNGFARWFHEQKVLYQDYRLSPDRVKKLREIVGYDLAKEAPEVAAREEEYANIFNQSVEHYGDKPIMDFEVMYKQLEKWREEYYTCHVPRQVFDAPVLGEWVHRIRKQHRRHALEEWKVDRLNELDFEWRVHQLDARWYSLYHHVRRYKEKFGTPDIPGDYQNFKEPNWVIASRWLARQHKLYFKQKLSPHKVKMLKELGIKLNRPYGPLKIDPTMQEVDPLRFAKLRAKHEEMVKKRKREEKRVMKVQKFNRIKEMERQELLNWYLPFGDPRFR